MYGSLTIKGYTFTDKHFDAEMESYLHKIPNEQRQGVKSMLDFFRLHSKESVVAFARKYFRPRQDKNMIISAIMNYMETDEYKKDIADYHRYIKSKNFHPATSYERMRQYQYYITPPLVLNEELFKKYKIRCEEDLEVLTGLKLFNNHNIKVRSNFIDTAINEIFKEELNLCSVN